MMKNTLYILLIIAFGFISCAKEINPNEVPADCIKLNVFNSPMTKAVDPTGAEYERQLKRLDCFFYVKGATDQPCVYYQKVELNKITQAEIPFYVDESIINTIFPGSNTTCDVLVLANLPDGTYAKDQNGTDVNTLYEKVLELGKGYDAIDQPFIMAGLDEAIKGDKNNATGTIPLERLASKITVTVIIPEQLVFKNEQAQDVVMKPEFVEDNGNVTLKSSFNNGANKTNLNATYLVNNNEDLFGTEKYAYTFQEEIPATSTDPKKYLYTCEIPFYSYARAWAKGDETAAYFTFELPWTNVTAATTQTYYYQILINAAGRCFEPNQWYDLTVNVGVLGSTVESQPTTIQDITYYVIDWTTEPDPEHEAGGDRYENVDIKDYTYLVVPEPKLVINNASTGVIHYDASHKLGLQMNTSQKNLIGLSGTTTSAAYYIYCGPDANGNTAQPKRVDLDVTKTNFTSNNSTGELIYNFAIPEDVFSPIYVYATIWLDFDGDGKIKTDYPDNYKGVKESDFIEQISIIQYPPIYVVPDLTTRYSIYVNNIIKTGDGSGDLVRYPETGNSYYGLGLVPGTNTTTGANPTFMYVVNVTSLKSTDGFYYNTDNNNNGPQTWYKYIIGDPRQRINDTDLNDDGYDMDQHWVTAPAVDNTNRKLQNYYPTSTAPGAFQIIAPKFRIVSFHGNGHRYHNYEGAKMRCASYQEDGFPAGRWRLPTYAEIQFVIKLQEDKVISPIFFGSSKYFSATNQITYNADGSTYMGFQDNSPGTINGRNGSVRCVYDEWYWGSDREAQVNPLTNPPAGEEYLFTWGDKQIW